MNDQQKPESTALVEKRAPILAGGSVKAIIPQSFGDICRLASVIAESGLAPKDFKTPQAITIAIMHGMEIGLPPMQALQRIATINGRPCLWGDAAIALVRASGLCVSIKETLTGSGDEMVARCVATRKGEPEPIIGTFSVADAKTAGLWKKAGPWTTNPKRMLQMRARGFCLRDGFADVLGGMYLAEEMQDTEMKDVTPITPPPIKRAAGSGPTIEGVSASSPTQADDTGSGLSSAAQSPAPSADTGEIPAAFDRRKKRGEVTSEPQPTDSTASPASTEPFSNDEADAYLADIETRFNTAPTWGDLVTVLAEYNELGRPRLMPPDQKRVIGLYNKATDRFES